MAAPQRQRAPSRQRHAHFANPIATVQPIPENVLAELIDPEPPPLQPTMLALAEPPASVPIMLPAAIQHEEEAVPHPETPPVLAVAVAVPEVRRSSRLEGRHVAVSITPEELRAEEEEWRMQAEAEAAARCRIEKIGIARQADFVEDMVLQSHASVPVDSNPESPNYLRHDLGEMNIACHICGALHWKSEQLKQKDSQGRPVFPHCCFKGEVIYPKLIASIAVHWRL